MPERTCNDCGAKFDPKKSHRVVCNACNRPRAAAWRKRRKAAGNPVISSKLPKEWHRAYKAEYCKRPEVKQRLAELMRGYAKGPLRPHFKARSIVANAIQAGRLKRHPCEVCGDKAQAHHDDYSKPLDVRWLCAKHHREHHAVHGKIRASEVSLDTPTCPVGAAIEVMKP